MADQRQINPIDCSEQPLDFAFHPTRNILAAGLVDGTLEVHDFTSRLESTKNKTPPKTTKAYASMDVDLSSQDDDDEEEDTIVSSISIHCNTPQNSISKPTHTHTPSSPATIATKGPSCRATLFSSQTLDNASQIYSGGNYGSLASINVERASSSLTATSDADCILWKIEDASPNGINCLYQMDQMTSSVGPLVVTGDDEGVVRLWDVRTCANRTSNSSKGAASSSSSSPFDNLMSLPDGCVSSFHYNKDYITGFHMDKSGNTLLASSADGHLSIFDIRKNQKLPPKHERKSEEGPFQLIKQSDDQEDELLSMAVIKGGKKVICGTQDGVIAIWSWGTWGDISDRFPGHPKSIETILKVDEDTIITGSSDGLVRVMQIQPNKLLGVMGDHDGFPIEKLLFSADRHFVGSLCHDNFIRLWDASILRDDDDGDDDDDDDDNEMQDDEEEGDRVQKFGSAKAAASGNGSEDDWEDMSDSDDSDDDSDEEDNGGGKQRVFKTENEKFFEDL